MGYLLLHESENDGRNLYESFEITFDNVPCAKVLGEEFENSLSFLENVHFNNFAVLFRILDRNSKPDDIFIIFLT